MLAEWLFPKTRWVILKALFVHPEQEFYVSQLIRLGGGGSAQMQRELRRFVRDGLLKRSQAGSQVRYTANRDHPLFPEIRMLVLKTAGLADVLRERLSAISGISVAFVYGSFARGEERADSDVDVMVIGELDVSEVVGSLTRAQDELRRDLNPSVFPPAEFREKLLAGDHFLQRVVAGPKLFLVGDAHDLERVGRAAS